MFCCAAPLKAPKWYKRPAGVSFGFGGKIVSFHTKSSVAGASTGGSEVGLVGALPLIFHLLDLNFSFPLSLSGSCV